MSSNNAKRKLSDEDNDIDMDNSSNTNNIQPSRRRRRLSTINGNNNGNNNRNNSRNNRNNNNNNDTQKKKNEKKRLQVSKKDVIAGLKSGKMILLKKTEFNKRTKSNDKHWKAFRHVVYADGLHKGDAVYGSRNGYWVFCDDCKDYGEGLLDLNADSTTNTMNSHLKKCGKNNSNHNSISSYFGAKDTNATDTTLQFSETEKLQIRKDCVELVALNKRSFKIVKDEGVVSICHRFYNLGVKHGIYATDLKEKVKKIKKPDAAQSKPTSRYSKLAFKVEDEVASYIELNHSYSEETWEKIDKNPRTWWNSDDAKPFPTLKKISRNILITPASSAPSETIFSGAGHTVGKKRTRLFASKVDLLIFLGSYLRYLNHYNDYKLFFVTNINFSSFFVYNFLLICYYLNANS